MWWPGLQRAPAEPLPPVAPAAMTEGRIIYAVGDVHGRLDLLETLWAAILDDVAASRPAARPLVVFVGDYVDRGPDSRGVIDALLAFSQEPSVEVEALRGNHEAAMLGFLMDVDAGPVWATWGGDATLRSYGVAAPGAAASPADWAGVQAAFADAVPDAHVEFLKGLPLSLMVGGYLFAHAGVRPGVAFEAQEPEDLLMIRSPFLEHGKPLGRIVVHGHTPEDEPFVSPVRIGVDTGAYATGVLTAARLEAEAVSFLQATPG